MAFLEALATSRGFRTAEIEARLSVPGNAAFYSTLGYEACGHIFYEGRTARWYVMRKRLGESEATR